MKLKKGDQVKVITGKDRGKTGTIIKVHPDENRLVLEGLNLYKKRVRPKQQGKQGQTVLVPRPLAASNVLLLCPNCKEATRAGYRVDGNQKVRYCKKCEATV